MRPSFFISLIIFLFVIYSGCKKSSEQEKAICIECKPFVGEYELVAVKTLIGDMWQTLPAEYYQDSIYTGYLKFDEYGNMEKHEEGISFNWISWHHYDFSVNYTYTIIDDSLFQVNDEYYYPANFYPHLNSQTTKIDTIIWGPRRYIR